MVGKVQTRIERLIGNADTFGYGKTGIEGFGIDFGSGCRTLFDEGNVIGFSGWLSRRKESRDSS